MGGALEVLVGEESIRALATVTLDARSLESLGAQTLDRLAELVEARLMLRRAAGEEPLLSAVAAAELVDVSPATVRRAIRSGALEVAGYVGSRPACVATTSWRGSREVGGRRPY